MSEQRFDTPAPVRLEVKLASGEVRVETGDEAVSTVGLTGAPRAVESTTVDLAGDRLIIAQRRKSLIGFFERWDEPLQVHVTLPHGSRIEMITASAGATLDGRFGEVEMKSASGDLRMTGEVEGDVTVKTASGDARLARVAGDVDVRTVSGDVEAESVAGSVAVKSVSGDVHVGSLSQGRVSVQSVSGDVELGIAPGTSIDVDANTASGALTSEVPLSDVREAGDAGPTVVIRGNTVSGDFRLTRAA